MFNNKKTALNYDLPIMNIWFSFVQKPVWMIYLTHFVNKSETLFIN